MVDEPSTATDAVRVNIKRLMEERGLTARQLGRLCDLSDRTVGQFLDGVSMSATTRTLHKIATGLGVSVAVLMRPAAGEYPAVADDALLVQVVQELRTIARQNTKIVELLEERLPRPADHEAAGLQDGAEVELPGVVVEPVDAADVADVDGEDLQAAFSTRLKEARARLGLSQSQLARALGVSANRVHTWESGRNYPLVPDLGRICDLLGVTADWLYFGRATTGPTLSFRSEPPP
ncbi:MAG: helix-turn-helix transcriptional regulator [Geminicoccaceae bacterium]